MIMADATILVVDDEPALLEIFCIWLKRYGATVLKASNGEQALKILTTQKVSALISDMRMPVMDGVTLIRSLHDLNLTIPTVIFVSGFGDVSPRVLYSLGVEALLPKPLARNQLITTLQASLRTPGERWLDPLPSPAEHRLSIDFQGLEEALRDDTFHLGRGGFCAFIPHPLSEGTVDFHLTFPHEGLALDGEGIVRWYDPKSQRVGVEFVYIDPKARSWVLERIQSREIHCFIPLC